LTLEGGKVAKKKKKKKKKTHNTQKHKKKKEKKKTNKKTDGGGGGGLESKRNKNLNTNVKSGEKLLGIRLKKRSENGHGKTPEERSNGHR